MNFEERFLTLIRKLKYLGYTRFQVRQIISEAVGQQSWVKDNDIQNQQVINALEKYGVLGNEYLQAYSK
jgi:hypothetical protein